MSEFEKYAGFLKEISSLIRCMYDLMGPNVSPPVDEQAIANHVESVIQVGSVESKN